MRASAKPHDATHRDFWSFGRLGGTPPPIQKTPTDVAETAGAGAKTRRQTPAAPATERTGRRHRQQDSPVKPPTSRGVATARSQNHQPHDPHQNPRPSPHTASTCAETEEGEKTPAEEPPLSKHRLHHVPRHKALQGAEEAVGNRHNFAVGIPNRPQRRPQAAWRLRKQPAPSNTPGGPHEARS